MRDLQQLVAEMVTLPGLPTEFVNTANTLASEWQSEEDKVVKVTFFDKLAMAIEQYTYGHPVYDALMSIFTHVETPIDQDKMPAVVVDYKNNYGKSPDSVDITDAPQNMNNNV